MSEAHPQSPVQEGDIIGGKFRVERVLGVGGMGVVVAAMHLDLDQRVALKFLLPEAAHRPDVAARFSREAKAAAKIHSEHVAKVLDVGTLPDGGPYMVMEYMDGEDLEHVLAGAGQLAPELAASYVLQASEAIAEAHALGIVHRDLKPANLFLANRPNGDPIIKVLDFGISKSSSAMDTANLTKTSAVMGSPLYMSPEQLASSKSVDTRSDIWALGVVLYELLTGLRPFPAETMPELVAAILQREHVPVSELRPDIAAGFEAVVHKCLEKEPKRRFQNVAELAAALAPFGPPRSEVSVERIAHVLGIQGDPLQARLARTIVTVAGPGAKPTSSAADQAIALTNSQWSLPGAAAQGGRGKLALRLGAPLVFAVLCVGGLVWALRGGHPPDASASASSTSSSLPLASGAPGTSAPRPAATPADTAGAAAGAASGSTSGATDAPPSASTAPPSIASAPAPIAPATATAATAAPPPVRAPVATPKAPAPPAAPATPTCHMVSFFDSDGNKRFKRECK